MQKLRFSNMKIRLSNMGILVPNMKIKFSQDENICVIRLVKKLSKYGKIYIGRLSASDCGS